MPKLPKLPREPEAFAEAVARAMGRGGRHVRVVGPMTLDIEGDHVELADVHRAVLRGRHDTMREVERVVEAMMQARRLASAPVPFEVVAPRIFPRIRESGVVPISGPGEVLHQAFVNDTVIVYVIDVHGADSAITAEQAVRWGVPAETIDSLARHNLATVRSRLEVQLIAGEEGTAATFNTGDGLDASRLLLGQLYESLAPALGGDFAAAIPSRDVLIACALEPDDFVLKVQQRIEDDFRKLPYPITTRLFLVTRDGVARYYPDAA